MAEINKQHQPTNQPTTKNMDQKRRNYEISYEQ